MLKVVANVAISMPAEHFERISRGLYILFSVADAGNLLNLIADAVFLYGMDDEYAPTEIGKRLYHIYDEILYQECRQEEKEKSNDSEWK